jgi:hypothetical protein
MSATDISFKDVHYRIFATRESRKFRAFWFCPHPDCYGAYRSERLLETKEDAIADARAAARLHETQQHESAYRPFREEDYEVSGRLVIHG